MSEIVVANLFFDNDKNTGIIGGQSSDTFTFRAGGIDQLIANDSVLTLNNASISLTAPVTINENGANSILYLGRTSGQPTIEALNASGDWLIIDGGNSSGSVGLNYYSSGDVILTQGGGNVAIGGVTANNTLTVHGNALITGNIVSNTTFTDNVTINGTSLTVNSEEVALGGMKITVSSTAPSSPSDGDIWIDTS